MKRNQINYCHSRGNLPTAVIDPAFFVSSYTDTALQNQTALYLELLTCPCKK